MQNYLEISIIEFKKTYSEVYVGLQPSKPNPMGLLHHRNLYSSGASRFMTVVKHNTVVLPGCTTIECTLAAVANCQQWWQCSPGASNVAQGQAVGRGG